MECTFKKSGINNLKVLFLFHRLLYNILEKLIKNRGHQTIFHSGEQNLPLPPHILRIFNIKRYGVYFLSFISIYITGRKYFIIIKLKKKKKKNNV